MTITYRAYVGLAGGKAVVGSAAETAVAGFAAADIAAALGRRDCAMPVVGQAELPQEVPMGPDSQCQEETVAEAASHFVE